MSRIDEALRRATAEDAASVSPTPVNGNGDAFASPWKFGGRAPVPESGEPEGHPSHSVLEVVDSNRSVLIEGFNPKWKERLAISRDADWLLVEQFRRLAATLHQAQLSGGTKTVMITSASPGDGKTLTAMNLALILSESYRRRVLLIDADLRRPTLRDITHLPDTSGLSDGLKAKTDQKLSAFPMSPTLTLLPAGRPDPDPMSGLTSPRMARILEEAAVRFDWVILDAPPVGTLADANLLAGMVDGALLVVRAGQTQYSLVQKAIDGLGRERILGVVLNGLARTDDLSYSQYYAGYQSQTPPRV